MFITCQECNTTYRLDEKALKPTGSKVRCSQCGHLFVAVPATAAPVQEPALRAVPTPEKRQPAVKSPAAEEKALGGIDLAELDALVKDGGREENAAATEDTAALDDTNLDIDFDAAIESVEADAEDELGVGELDPEDIELDMDFEIDDALLAEDGLEGLDSEVAGGDVTSANHVTEKVAAGGDPSLEDDLESVLDGLEMDAYEPVETAEVQSDGQAAEDDDLGLDDLDFDLESEDLAGEDAGLDSELSLDEDLDLSLDEPEPAQQAPVVEDSAADELDLNLDLDLEDESAEAEPVVEDMELSLDDDFDLQLDEAPAGEDKDQKGSAEDEDDFDLAGLDTILGTGDEVDQGDSDLSLDDELDLELDEEPAVDQANQKGAAGDDDDLDLNGLDTLLGIGDEMEDAESELSLGDEIDLQDDLELSLDETPSKVTAAAKKDDGGEINLAGLDNFLDVEEDRGEKTASDSEEPELELDELDLALDSEASQATATDASDTADQELEELDFELDAEFEEDATSDEISMEEDEEVDLSDIEQMLGGDEKPILPKTPAKMPKQETGLGGVAEIDLGEIESALDEAELTNADDSEVEEEPELALDANFDKVRSEVSAGPEDLVLERDADGKAGDAEEDLELELELESESPRGGEGGLDLESELDLSDLGDLTEEVGAEVKQDGVVSSGDIELEFQIEEDEALEPSATFSKTTTGAAKAPMSPGDIPIDQTMETLAVEESAAPQPKPFKSKKKSSKSLVLAILLILLALIGGALYYAVVHKGIEIPFISEYLNPQPKDPNGTMRLSTLDINSNFIENSQAGRLFVITGKVRNGYSMSRSGIRLRGRLFTKGKSVAKTEFSYAGVVVSDQDLASLPVKVIKQRLSTEPDPQQPHGIARPGQNVSFMVVFSDLPSIEELDEFAVELVSSKAAP